MRREKFRAWFFLFRPWSYVATLVPFLLAAGVVGVHRAEARWEYWALGIVSGLLFQSTVNLLNTWGDEISGVDAVPGAIRTTPQVHDGIVSLRAVGLAGLTCAALASVLGVALCFFPHEGRWLFNVPLCVAGFVGLLGACNYSTGIKFKYRGLGVPFVSFLMGPLETFVAAMLLSPPVPGSCEGGWPLFLLKTVFVALPISTLVGVIMHGNDMRDIPTDRAAGIRTFATLNGVRGAYAWFWILHLVPYGVVALLVVFDAWTGRYVHALRGLLPFLALPLSLKVLKSAWGPYRAWCAEGATAPAPAWRGLERGSGAVHLVFGVLYALVWAFV